jgi:hypothetical protein
VISEVETTSSDLVNSSETQEVQVTSKVAAPTMEKVTSSEDGLMVNQYHAPIIKVGIGIPKAHIPVVQQFNIILLLLELMLSHAKHCDLVSSPIKHLFGEGAVRQILQSLWGNEQLLSLDPSLCKGKFMFTGIGL